MKIRFWTLLIVLLVSGLASAVHAKDFGQCQRRCREEFGQETQPKWVADDLCECFRDGKSLGKITRLYPFNPPKLGLEVCGINGKTYPTSDEAMKETTVLHGGACGQCSNTHDIGIYWKTAQTLTQTTKRCAVLYSVLGEAAGRACFEEVGLTPGCNDCWVDNMGCTPAHCLQVCIISQLKGEPNVINGKLNDCLACDENHCGDPFIRCAGANRRRSGIPSDIPRPGDDIWPKAQ